MKKSFEFICSMGIAPYNENTIVAIIDNRCLFIKNISRRSDICRTEHKNYIVYLFDDGSALIREMLFDRVANKIIVIVVDDYKNSEVMKNVG